MGFLSKILGEKAEKGALSFIDELVNEAGKAKQNEQSAPVNVTPAAQPQTYSEPSGNSWGPVMPQEENQFSYSGAYYDYFYNVFRDEFPEYEVTKDVIDKRNATVFTFAQGGSNVLIVEVMSQTGTSGKIRSDCAKQGIKYLRFYHNHNGWWNTRSYVAGRVGSALGK